MRLDLTTIAIAWIGGSLLLMPLLLLTIRSGVLPLLAAVERVREKRAWRGAGMERRLERTEAQLARLSAELEQLRHTARASSVSPHA